MILSRIRLVSCDLTRPISIFRGLSSAFVTADLVISLNTIRLSSLISRPSSCARCHEIASPSLSGSVARKTFSAFLASFFNSLTTSFLSFETTYVGSKLFSTSTPRPSFPLIARSRIWPLDETTL